VSALDDLRFWAQIFEDARRTILCPPSLGDKVRAIIKQDGVGGLYDVQESNTCPEDQILLIDHNAMDADTRQAIHRMRKGPM
jgi:hypothetical protein